VDHGHDDDEEGEDDDPEDQVGFSLFFSAWTKEENPRRAFFFLSARSSGVSRIGGCV
jgi:hypothetical protein